MPKTCANNKKHNHFGIESKKNIIILDLNSNKTFVTIQALTILKTNS
jgi:hypothetical protein